MSPRRKAVAPPALIAHARLAADLFEAVRLRLRDPKAALPSRLPRAVDDSLAGSFREAALRLCDAADEAVWALEEIERLSFPVDDEILRLSSRLRDAAEALLRAVSSRGEAAADALIEAKKHAGEAERYDRIERVRAQDDPRFVDGLKREGIARRLSQSAEDLQRAVDAVGEALAT